MKIGKKIAHATVLLLSAFASIGLYGMLREGGTEIVSSLAICVTYAVGFHHIIYDWILN